MRDLLRRCEPFGYQFGVIDRMMCHWRRFCLGVFAVSVILLQALAAPPQVPKPAGSLSLDDCIHLANSAPSAVTQARQQLEIARRGITEARAGFLPEAHFNGAYTYNSPLLDALLPQSFSFVALNGIREYATQVGTGVELDTSGRLRAAMRRAEADRDASTAGLGLSQRDLKRAVAAAYYRLLLARRLVQVDHDSLEEARSFEDLVTKLLKGGEAAQADLYKAQAQTAFLEQAAISSELDAQLANQDLASYWTASVEQTLNIQDIFNQEPPPPETSAQLGATPFLGRPEFRLFDAQKRSFLADARQARSTLYPQTTLDFQWGLDSNYFAFHDRGYAAFLTLNVTLWDWFKTRSAEKQFELQAAQVDANADIAKRTFSRDYQAALARVQSTYRQIEVTQRQTKASEENLRLSRVRYEGGEGLALDVVAAMQQLVQARSNYFAALANYYNARADLEVAAAL